MFRYGPIKSYACRYHSRSGSKISAVSEEACELQYQTNKISSAGKGASESVFPVKYCKCVTIWLALRYCHHRDVMTLEVKISPLFSAPSSLVNFLCFSTTITIPSNQLLSTDTTSDLVPQHHQHPHSHLKSFAWKTFSSHP